MALGHGFAREQSQRRGHSVRIPAVGGVSSRWFRRADRAGGPPRRPSIRKP
jgi:hypothetical protein